MTKIVSIRGEFENMRAFLARIAEDERAVGFVGMIIRDNEGSRDMIPVNFKTSRAESAYASIALGKMALEDD